MHRQEMSVNHDLSPKPKQQLSKLFNYTSTTLLITYQHPQDMPTWVRCFTGKILNLKIESIPTHIYEEIGWSKYNIFFLIYYVVKYNVRDFILVGSNIPTCNSCLNKNVTWVLYVHTAHLWRCKSYVW
jgi:hypothetical protein